jgi:hypothetical protein
MINTINTDEIYTEWSIPKESRDKYDKYFILHYKGDYLFKLLLDNYSLIFKDAIKFVAKPYDRTGLLPEIYSNPDAQFALSFRKLINSRDGIVLIKRVYTNVTN